jgi:hypothetical protein
MYNGHQSSNVIAVTIKDMKKVTQYPEYTSHSFDERVLVSQSGKTVFVDHGDAGGTRGFNFTIFEGDKSTGFVPFSFGDTPSHYNNTFAQLGGIGEVSTGIVLVGASAKSLNANAAKEPQNIFVQIFNPDKADVTTGISYITVGTRTGTSDGIKTTNYGVQWLTSYTSGGVLHPQVVTTDDDRIVVLWERYNGKSYDSYYMLLAANGKVLKKSTKMAGIRLNAFEDPIYANGAVYWVSGSGTGENAKSDGKKLSLHRLVIK